MPIPGQPITPINYGQRQSVFTLNLRLSKTFGLGPKVESHSASGGQRRRWQAVVAVEAVLAAAGWRRRRWTVHL